MCTPENLRVLRGGKYFSVGTYVKMRLCDYFQIIKELTYNWTCSVVTLDGFKTNLNFKAGLGRM